MWSSHRNILRAVEQAAHSDDEVRGARSDALLQDQFAALRELLQDSLPEFVLLAENWNPKRNAVPGWDFVFAKCKDADDRRAVKAAVRPASASDTDRAPIRLAPMQRERYLTQEMVDAALQLSDLYDMNEVTAAGLVAEGDEHQSALLRGTSLLFRAVYSYHEAREALLSALSILLVARRGRTYGATYTAGFHDLATEYLEQFDGLTANLLSRCMKTDVAANMKMLEGAPGVFVSEAEKKLMQTVLEGEAETLANCVFNMAVQSTVTPTMPPTILISESDVIGMMVILRRKATSPDKPLDPLCAALWTALLYLLDIPTSEDRSPQVLGENPLTQDVHFHHHLFNEPWENEALQRTLILAYALTSMNETKLLQALPVLAGDGHDEDDDISLFAYMAEAILGSRPFQPQHDYFMFYMEAVHFLLTKLVEDWSHQVHQLQKYGQDAAQKGLPHNDLRDLMRLVGLVYRSDHHSEMSTLHWDKWENFVRESGASLPEDLYIPYVSMLAGFAGPEGGAHLVYELLEINGRPGFRNSIVSWTRLFNAMQECADTFKQQAASHAGGFPGSDAMLLQQQQFVTMHESYCVMLESFVNLLRRVVENDRDARLKILENPQWSPMYRIFNLVGTPVPPKLKAALFGAVEAFCATPDASALAWSFVRSSFQTDMGGIRFELEELEPTNNTYPETTAFLLLLHRLIPFVSPPTPGSSELQPFIDFLRDSVLLKFNCRGYAEPSEKWVVASCVLRVYLALIESYVPDEGDFAQMPLELGGGVVGPQSSGAAAGGFQVIQTLLNEPSAASFRVIMYVLECGAERVNTQQEKPWPREHETAFNDAVLYALRITEQLFAKQELFRHFGVVHDRVEDYLVEINPVTHQSKGVLNVASFLAFNFVPEQALCAAKVIYRLSVSLTAQPKLISIFRNQHEVERDQMLFAFEQRLGDIRPEGFDAPAVCTDVVDEGHADIHNAISYSILHLLLSSLTRGAPNLAHLLLGFPLKATDEHDISQATLAPPDRVAGQRSCLHAILRLIGSGTLAETNPSLAELCYKVVHRLCDNQYTSSPVMRYLRDHEDFFRLQLENLQPIRRYGESSEACDRSYTAQLNQQGWLLKTIALELYLTAKSRERTHTHLVDLLFGTDQGDDEGGEMGETTMASQQAPRMCLLRLLDAVELTAQTPSPPALGFFDRQRVNAIFESCTRPRSSDGVLWCDIKTLHEALVYERDMALQAADVNTTSEIEQILEAAMDVNLLRESQAAKENFLKGWQRVTEVTLIKYPLLLGGVNRAKIIAELLTDLFSKVSAEGTIPQLMSVLSELKAILMANLRETLILASEEQSSTSSGKGGAAASSGRTLSAAHRAIADSEMTGLSKGRMRHMLDGIMDGIMRSDTAPRTRQNYYGALMFYVQIASESVDEDHGLDRIHQTGERFLDVVCRDASDGQGIGAILAMSALDALMAMDHEQRWLHFLQRHGYLINFVDDIVRSDEELLGVLVPTPQQMRTLYVHQARMSLLNRIALLPGGAGVPALLHAEVLWRLSRCRFVGARPLEDSGEGLFVGGQSNSPDEYVPQPLERYRQIVFPILQLAISMLESNTRPADVVGQVLHFVAAHADKLFRVVLKDRARMVTPSALEELSLVTAVLRRLAGPDIEDSARAILEHHHPRLQTLMIALLSKFSERDSWMSRVDLAAYPIEEQEEIESHVQHIIANLIAYVRTLMDSPIEGTSEKFQSVSLRPRAPKVRILLRPSLARASEDASMPDRPRFPSLGVLLRHLDLAHAKSKASKIALQKARDDLAGISDLTYEELKELAPSRDNLSKAEQLRRSRPRLEAMVTTHEKALELSMYIVENTLYVLWRHLQWYLYFCEPSAPLSLEVNKGAAGERTRVRVLRVGANGREIEPSLGEALEEGDAFQTLVDLRFKEFSKSELQSLQREALSDPAFSRKPESLLELLCADEKAQWRDHDARREIVQPLVRRIGDLLRDIRP